MTIASKPTSQDQSGSHPQIPALGSLLQSTKS
jgi:hypothetical protein